jgi:PHD/YefM family antitoxin component YafN of YafNO toxin-antitoxin module
MFCAVFFPPCRVGNCAITSSSVALPRLAWQEKSSPITRSLKLYEALVLRGGSILSALKIFVYNIFRISLLGFCRKQLSSVVLTLWRLKGYRDMPSIKSSTQLRNNYNEISSFCHESREPVFITKNGQGDLAVMSIEAFEILSGKLELYRLIDEGRAAIEESRKRPFSDVMHDIRQEMADGRL